MLSLVSASRHRPCQESHLRERSVERSGALSPIILAVTVEPAPFGVTFDLIVVVFEDLDLRPDVGGLPGNGADEGMKLDGCLRVSNLLDERARC